MAKLCSPSPRLFSLTAASLLGVLISSAVQAQQVRLLQAREPRSAEPSRQPELDTMLERNLSVVASATESFGSVMRNLIEDEIQSLPAPSASVSKAASIEGKTVKLIIPVKTGLEFAQIQQIEAGAKILEMEGKIFVQVSETTQALPAYKKGKALQRRFGCTFELAYSVGHPDLNLVWMQSLAADLADPPWPTVQPLAALPLPIPVVVVRSGKAADLGPLSLFSASLAAQSLDSVLQVNLTLEPQPESDRQPIPKQVSTLKVNAAIPALTINPAGLIVALPADRRSSLSKVLAELRLMTNPVQTNNSHAHITAQPVAPTLAVTTGLPQSWPARSLVRAVAIQPVDIGDIPIVSARYMATNRDLDYLFVKVSNRNDLLAVQKVAPVTLAHPLDHQFLARVGVYTSSRTGRRMRDQQWQKLKEFGYQVEIVAGRSAVSLRDDQV